MNRLFLSAAALLGLVACGGGGGSTVAGGAAPSLSYVNPTLTQDQFALILDPTATPTLLVLDLVGPESTPACGVTFGFDVDATRAAWSTSPAVVSNGTLFTPASGTQLVQGWVSGARLQAIVANKGLANQVADIGRSQGVIGQIRLTPAAGAAAGTVSLVDNGLGTLLDNSGTPVPIQVQVGTLTLN